MTVAKEIELKDPSENAGALMVRDVASKTSDVHVPFEETVDEYISRSHIRRW